ncbi:UDP-N-acetylmuramoyl-L-alanine--D-glutamate ligase [Pontibacter sp. G13]|uniref:UDP-N-acetylmuramoyl-L-alanine--D-glutamate ligase n=1 Tax=Pontibacter sp. G13 TaxID=3074898 RepID=UPI00288B72CC|nr:UDP-N-acetylmuramoyl-L-alanine--D-glutamate ligase [Pontibacter sp. G13]WNJ20256.1 UDP-N-acetylmuramoyl-L-alanine--D-glutamate ligase [Pontibacter sp. G13]
MRKTAILGAGESGVGAAILAKQLGHQVWVSDRGEISDRFRSVLTEYQIPFETGVHTDAQFFDADVIVKSPGIPDTAPLVQRLKHAGKSVISEIEFAFRHAQGTVVAITGSNGKTTTTSLIHHVMVTAGKDAALVGNIGRSFAWQIADQPAAYYVLEVSSFQLDDIEQFQPDVALLLNITPDHLDRYGGSIKRYGAAKMRISENQTADQTLIVYGDDAEIADQMQQRKGDSLVKRFGFEQTHGEDAWTEGHWLKSRKGTELDFSKMKVLGPHNQLNALAAMLALEAVGLSQQEMEAGFYGFQPIEHRLEPVSEVNGVLYINDSKATNVDAAKHALASMDRPTVWMVGGVDKGNDYTEILDLVEEHVKLIIVVGEGSEKISHTFSKEWIHVKSMQEAVRVAQERSEPGDAVLLSPACASFDLFRNYMDRGNQFRDAVLSLQ